MAAKDPDAVAAMRALRDSLRRKLEESEEYRALVALEEAIAKVVKPLPAASAPKHGVEERRPTSQAEAAWLALQNAGKPLTIAELIKELSEAGVTVGGANPKINLSSTLSRDERFVSMKWNNSACWWLADRQPPEDAE